MKKGSKTRVGKGMKGGRERNEGKEGKEGGKGTDKKENGMSWSVVRNRG